MTPTETVPVNLKPENALPPTERNVQLHLMWTKIHIFFQGEKFLFRKIFCVLRGKKTCVRSMYTFKTKQKKKNKTHICGLFIVVVVWYIPSETKIGYF